MTLVLFLGVLSILVLVHEFGHYMAARLFKIKVEEFAFGLPLTRALVSVKRGETKYSIYPVLFGGFVKLYGEEEVMDKAKQTKEEQGRDFLSRGKKQRMAVIVAGVVMNVVLAMVGFVVLYTAIGIPNAKKDLVTITLVSPGSPAEKVGMMDGDRIISVEGKQISSLKQFSELITSWGGVAVNIKVQRGKTLLLFEGFVEQGTEEKSITVIPRINPPKDQGAIGVGIYTLPYYTTTPCRGLELKCLGAAVKQGSVSTISWIGKVFDGLREIGKSLLALKAPEGVAGPVGIYRLTGTVAQGGIFPVIEMIAILSVNLAVFNVLPIPALDGGRMLFIWLEWIRRKRLSVEFEQKVNSWGMVVLVIFLLLITLQDVLQTTIVQKLLGK